MKMARADEKELDDLAEFFNGLEKCEDGVEKSEFIHHNYHLIKGWQRIVFGYSIMFDNACDPNCDTLEFKPEIKKQVERIAELEAENERLKSYLEQINSIMWQSWGVKGAIFGHAQGEEIMKVLEKWSKNDE